MIDALRRIISSESIVDRVLPAFFVDGAIDVDLPLVVDPLPARRQLNAVQTFEVIVYVSLLYNEKKGASGLLFGQRTMREGTRRDVVLGKIFYHVAVLAFASQPVGRGSSRLVLKHIIFKEGDLFGVLVARIAVKKCKNQ